MTTAAERLAAYREAAGLNSAQRKHEARVRAFLEARRAWKQRTGSISLSWTWIRYTSRTGHTAWKNQQTGEIRYQEKEPGTRHKGQPDVATTARTKTVTPSGAVAARPLASAPPLPNWGSRATKVPPVLAPAPQVAPTAPASQVAPTAPEGQSPKSGATPSPLSQHVQKVQKQLGAELPKINAIFEPHRAQIQTMNPGQGLPSINTVASTKDKSLSAQQHTAIATGHARIGAAMKATGYGKLAESHFAAARMHNGLAERKQAPPQQPQPARQVPPAGRPAVPTAKPSQSAAKPPLAKPSTAPAASPDHGRYLSRIQEHLSRSGLPAERQKAYHAAMARVLPKVPAKAMARAERHTRDVKFYADAKSLTSNFATNPKAAEAMRKGRVLAGAWQGGAGRLHLDGDIKRSGDAIGSSRTNIHETYAHELSHAIDGPRYEHSGSHEWERAWHEEIGHPQSRKPASLSAYARTSAAEGFAEMGRLVYGTDTDRGAIEKRFPKCVAYWKKAGLWQ
jgi:hypothetical protein